MSARFLLLIAVALWGFSSPVAKFSLGYLPAQLLLTYRFGLIVLLLSIPVYLARDKIKSINWLKLTLMGLLGTLGQIGLIYLGFNYTTAIEGTLLISSSPIFVAIGSYFFLKEKITRQELFGYGFGTLGTLILLVGPFTNSIGNFLIILANCCWAGFIIIDKKISHKPIPLTFITWWMFLVGFIGMLTITLFTLPVPVVINSLITLPLAAHVAVLYLAIAAGIIAYLLYQTALKVVPAAEAELFNYLTPIFSTPLAFIWLGEEVSPTFYLSAALITLGIILAEVLPYFHRNRPSHSKRRLNRRP